MGLALALNTEPDLAAPTEFQPVPPRLVELAEPVQKPDTHFSNPGVLLQAESLAKRFPESAAVQSRLASAAVIEDEQDLARDAALKAIDLAIKSDDAPALIAASQVLAALGQPDVAIEALAHSVQLAEPAAALEPGVIALFYAEILASQREFAAALRVVAQVEEPAAFALRGWIQLEEGNYAAAIRELRGALATGEPQADVQSNLAYAYAALGESAKAYSASRQAIHLAPTSRVIALNLVGYQFAAGDIGAALETLIQLRKEHPDDVMLEAAIADASLRLGDAKGALKTLRAARDRLDKVSASVRERAEILANTAFMEWRLGRRSNESAIEAIRKELLRCDYESIDIGRMLARLLTGLSQQSQLETVVRGLSQVHPRETLFEFETHLAFMRGEFGKALAAAKRWAIQEPFEVAAPVTVTYLLSEVEGKYEEAARFGEEALRRIPNSALLRNNIAFGWALAGAPDRAAGYLNGLPDTPYTLATRGVIRLAAGDIEGGNAEYDRAAALAEKNQNPELATLVRIRRLFSMLELGIGTTEYPTELVKTLADSDDPVAEVYRRQAKRFLAGGR